MNQKVVCAHLLFALLQSTISLFFGCTFRAEEYRLFQGRSKCVDAASDYRLAVHVDRTNVDAKQ